LFFRQLDENGRTSLAFGSVANSNDYSGHLIFVIPSLLWVILINKSKHLRLAAFLALALGLYEVLAAGSRGAVLGLITAVLVFAFTTTAKIRRFVLVTVPILGLLVIALQPISVRHRLFSFDSEATSEALESAHDRKQVLNDSIRTTIQNPLLGIGPGQFSNVEGKRTRTTGQSLWIEAHNTFTCVASENGIPGLVLFMGGILSSLFLLNQTARLLAGKPNVEEVATAVMCVRIGLISFCVTVFFLNFAYFFYLPALAGIAIAVAASGRRLMRSRSIAQSRLPIVASESPTSIER
jgi:O-antigen ligase